MVSPESVEKIINDNSWYHRMALGHGKVTPVEVEQNLLPVGRLFKCLCLEGALCLDIGTMDGKMAFLMERMGGDVVAVDRFPRETILELIGAFDSTVKYEHGLAIERLPELHGKYDLFDFILCSGVAYHVYSPFELVLNIRRILKNKGIAIIETAILANMEGCFMGLNLGDIHEDYSTIWVGTSDCFRSILRCSCFRILAEAVLEGIEHPNFDLTRHAFLVQADRPRMLSCEEKNEWLSNLLAGRIPGLCRAYLGPQLDLNLFDKMPESPLQICDMELASEMLYQGDSSSYTDAKRILDQATPAGERGLRIANF